MDYANRLAISYYKTIAVINESHKVYLVQHQDSSKFYVKKILDVYNIQVYEYLKSNPLKGTPRIINYCEEDNQLILIEEYVSGTSLEELIARKQLNAETIADYLIQLCDIVKQLHSMNPPIVHRDIKPTNIIITPFGNVVLLDFNAAKYFTDINSTDTVLLGTQGYAASEQYGFGSSSPQTDIYSIGILLKELNESLADKTHIFDNIINHCTQIDPTNRYESINQLKVALKGVFVTDSKPESDSNIRSFLPPGFRSLTPWKMFLSSIGYIFIIWLCVSLEAENTFGFALWVERLFILAIMLFNIFGWFNYMDVQKYMPLCQSKYRNIRYIGVVFLNIAVTFGLFIILLIVESIIR